MRRYPYNRIGHILLATVLSTALVPITAHGHDEHVHEQLTWSDFLSSAGINAFLSDNLGPGFAHFEKDNMGWSDWEEFHRLTPNDKTNLQEQK